uniref:ATP synthase complex subunit 8 n=1 Tax=Allodontermes schultzei TaxID=377694 RepID=A0A1S5VPW9_9NEOP|nr:ATP synthase F0 subunit 8 [Allodontermes schultzei]AQP28030.1 ATP synthase F0 subunit 8 [Allodontermes schultzei]
MPQMMPMEWMVLYTTFLMAFLMFNIMNYFSQPPKEKKLSKSTISTNKMNWKW